MNQVKLFLITIIGLWSFCDMANAKVINCYYETYANYRPGDSRFIPQDIDASLCTHVSYCYFGITPTGEFKVLFPWQDLDSGMAFITYTMNQKKTNPNLKVLATVGGPNEPSINYSDMASKADKRQTFITSTLAFIIKHGFNGLNLHWQYPGQNGGRKKDKNNFIILLEELKNAFEPHNLELMVAVGVSKETASISYDIPSIAKHVDYINLMTYDFATAADKVLGFNAPLTGPGDNNLESAVEFWLQQGAPASKLLAGIAFYANNYKLLSPQQNAVGSPSGGPGSPGPFTEKVGMLSYYEICALNGTWTYNWADDYGVPYFYNSVKWISYDNVRSINLKMKFINSMNLAGAMARSIEYDDYNGVCGEKYPLLKAINRNIN